VTRPVIKLLIAVLPATLLLASNAWADPQEEARALKEESLKILKATTDRDAAPEEMAKCIFNLEKASSVLEAANDTDSDLAREVNSELYWARKRSTLAVDAALDKLHGVAGVKAPVSPKKPEPAKPSVAKADPNEPADPTAGMEAVRAAYQDAEKFAKAHASDDYVVSLHWFQMASLHPGTDLSLKALTLAREAQERFKAGNSTAKKDDIPDTPEMKLMLEADALAKAKQFDKAFTLYQESLKTKETLIAHRKLGQAYFGKAQQVKDEVIKKCETTYAKLREAYKSAFRMVTSLAGTRRVFNPNDPNYKTALHNYQAAYKEGDVALDLFDKAQAEFRAVLKLAPGGKDLTAAGLTGICIAQRPDARFRARQYLLGFLKDYKSGNDDELTIYEYCKTELERVTKGK
jgi:tetratricopeptide (TPR) repeat protein